MLEGLVPRSAVGCMSLSKRGLMGVLLALESLNHFSCRAFSAFSSCLRVVGA